MVLFDIMTSHWAMMTWHDARLAESAAALAQLQQVSTSHTSHTYIVSKHPIQRYAECMDGPVQLPCP